MIKFCLIAALLVSGCAACSGTTIFGVCSTGFVANTVAHPCTTSTNEVADGGTDGNWLLESTPSSGTPAAPFITDEGSFPFTGSACGGSCWAADTTTSKWISPEAAETSSTNDATGNYTYEETFSLAGLNPTTAAISGSWASDNGSTLELNGHTIATLSGTGTFISLTAFSIPSADFVSGTNVLEVVVTNNGGVTGVDVNITSATANPLPEPSSFGLMGIGLAGFGVLASRLRR